MKQTSGWNLFLLTPLLALCLVIVPVYGWQSDNGNGTFTNPPLYADFPDPDIIRVGNDFYFATTTFVNVPGLTILHSQDLVNWEYVSHVIPRLDGREQYDLKNGKAYRSGVFAPSLRYNKDTFYVVVTLVGQNTRIYHARDPRGPWNYHELDRGAFDPAWKKVRWLLATSSEPSFFIENVDQSPFNIGLRVNLSAFTPEEIAEFADRYGLPLTQDSIHQIADYVGGHPYLVHLLLDNISRDPTSQERLFDLNQDGGKVFRDHLHRYLIQFQCEAELAAAMKSVIAGKCCKNVRLESRLEAAGLIRRNERNQVVPLCRLYAEFFGREL